MTLSGFLGLLQPVSAAAADAPYKGWAPSERATRFLLYRAVRLCIERQTDYPDGDDISEGSLNGGTWWSGDEMTLPGLISNVPGTIVAEGEISVKDAAKDAIKDAAKGGVVTVIDGINMPKNALRGGAKCDETLRTAMPIFNKSVPGWDSYLHMFCDIGGYRDNGSNCINGSGKFGGFTSLNDASNTFASRIQAAWYGGGDVLDDDKMMDAASIYKANLEDFKRGCGVKQAASASGISEKFGYTILEPDLQNPGKHVTTYYEGDAKDTKVGQRVWKGGLWVSECGAIADQLSLPGFVDAYATWIKDHPDQEDKPLVAPPAPTGSADAAPSQCTITGGLGWILCPVLRTMGSMADSMYGFLSDNLLRTPPELFANTGDGGLHGAWNKFLGVANLLLAVVFVIIIYSQITGAGLSNYGIKRMLPRLILGAILVNLSFYICAVAVDISNILGFTLKGFFESIGASTTAGAPAPGSSWSWTKIIAAVIVGAAIAWMALSALVPALAAVIIALATVVFILLLRQVLIVVLIAVAPVAFALNLLPNTQVWFDKWRKMFFALLVVFPVISVVFGASSMASDLVGSTLAADNTVMQIFAGLLGVIPLFVVPSLLKGSIDAAGNIGAKINGIGKGVQVKGSKAAANRFERSTLGRYKAYRSAEGLKRSGLIQSGAYRGSNRNPLNWRRNAASQAHRAFNSSGISGEFGDRLASAGVAAASAQEREEISAQQVLLQSQAAQAADPTAYLKEQLEVSLKRGNSVGARAALSALKGQGEGGVSAIQSAIAQQVAAEESAGGTGAESRVMLSLRAYVNSEHSDMKAKDVRLTQWAGETNPEERAKKINEASLGGLTDEEVASQTTDSLASGEVTAERAQRILNNPNVTIKENKRATLAEAALRSPAGNDVPSTISSPTERLQ